MKPEKKCDYGMIGLGTMGRNLVYNMCDHNFSVAGFDRDRAQVEIFTKEAGGKEVQGYNDLSGFIDALKSPRVIIVLVPAGKAVDAVIEELKSMLGKGDLLVDCGNSHFTDTAARMEKLSKEQFHFMGVGVSGGENGARFGPSIMPGGEQEDYKKIAPMLEAISAKVTDEPCVTWLGTGAAGHYVKMVHNGIEYGLMQLIAESYHLLKRVGEMNNDMLNTVFSKWNEGKLHSYLVGITADIFLQKDDLTNKRLIEMIQDNAAQNGTGAWASEDSMGLQVPVSVIDTAVSARVLSSNKKERVNGSKILKDPEADESIDRNSLIFDMEEALYFAMIVTYAQGMSLLNAASAKYGYGLKLHEIAKIWRGGCIIRASLLEDIRASLAGEPNLPTIMMNQKLASALQNSQSGIRNIIQTATKSGVPVPALMASLAYYDTIRSEWLPANLIQAQRDCFGAHTYKRNDREGVFHTHWDTKQN